jgi:2-polyprenyl-3-methyl-5-hydroxy-6-metoxy-1,4-benzoquinol methylase
MSSDDERWIENLFIEKGELFLKVLNQRWKSAEEEVSGIINLFGKYGIGRDVRILEIGCGNGRIVINLARKGYSVVGVDISPVLIEDAVLRAEEYGVRDRTSFYVCDVRKLAELFGDERFDVILSVWTTVLGYYKDDETNIDIFRQCRMIAEDGGYLMVLNTANRDYIAMVRSIGCTGPFYNEMDDMVVIEKHSFDIERSIAETTWSFYRKDEDRNLYFIDEVKYSLRLYSLHEVIRLCELAGWRYMDSYGRITTLEPFRPALHGLNIVFKAS